MEDKFPDAPQGWPSLPVVVPGAAPSLSVVRSGRAWRHLQEGRTLQVQVQHVRRGPGRGQEQKKIARGLDKTKVPVPSCCVYHLFLCVFILLLNKNRLCSKTCSVDKLKGEILSERLALGKKYLLLTLGTTLKRNWAIERKKCWIPPQSEFIKPKYGRRLTNALTNCSPPQHHHHQQQQLSQF